MHTNISEANMMVLRTENSQGILVGFEFALLGDRPPESKRIRSESLLASEARGTTKGSCEMTFASGEPFDGATTHHVASLPLVRCSDHPPSTNSTMSWNPSFGPFSSF